MYKNEAVRNILLDYHSIKTLFLSFNLKIRLILVSSKGSFTLKRYNRLDFCPSVYHFQTAILNAFFYVGADDLLTGSFHLIKRRFYSFTLPTD